MNKKMFVFLCLVVLLSVLVVNIASAQAPDDDGGAGLQPASASLVGTAINYQGQLYAEGQPVGGNCDFNFSLWNALSGPSQIGATIPKVNIPLENGIFFVDNLDFGAGAFNGDPRWLQIEVRCPTGVGVFTILAPRIAVLPAPYAVYSGDSDRLDGMQAGDFYSSSGGDLWGNIRYNNSTFGDWQIGSGGLLNPVPPFDVLREWFFISDPDDLIQPYRLLIDKPTGYVGIAKRLGVGTDLPESELHVIGSGQFDLSGAKVMVTTPQGDPGFIAWANDGSRRDIRFTEDQIQILATDSDAAPSSTSGIVIQENGDVGVGTTTPASRFHVLGESTFSGLANFLIGGGQISMSTPGGWPGVIAFAPNGHRREVVLYDDRLSILVSNSSSASPHGSGIIIAENGNVGIGMYPSYKLDVDGHARTRVLHISGGDLAEPFIINGKPEPGMAVVIDAENPGQLRLSDKANDRLVAGCISGANGLEAGVIMYQEIEDQENAFPVALSGRVYCYVDASYGAVKPGDLLTTSDTPGYLMAVSDYELAQGAIVGKAMDVLEEGQGLVLILVTLQ